MKKIIALAVAAVVAAPAMADLTIGANAEYQLDIADGDATSSLETNLQVSASTTSDSGITVGAFTEIEATGVDGDTVQLDDIYMTVGNDMATLTVAEVGGFATMDAFSLGADTAAQITTSYGANSQERKADTALTITPVAGVTLQVAGSISDVNDGYSLYAAYAADAVSVAASMEDGGTDATTGYALSVGTNVGGAALSAAYAANDNSEDMTRVSVGMAGFTVSYATDGTDDDIYGEYAVGEIAPGVDVTLAAGNYEGDSLVAVNVFYSF